jgi:hypothetical protein
MLSLIYGECRKQANYGECHYGECRHAECHYAECHYGVCHYGECHAALKRLLKIFVTKNIFMTIFYCLKTSCVFKNAFFI